MAGTLLGEYDWSMSRDEEGYRNYSITWLIETSDPADGPLTVMLTPGLPASGSLWAFGNDTDLSAYCWPNWTIRPILTQEPNTLWTVEQQFSNRPMRRCQTTEIENPLAEPDRIGGTFVKYTKLARKDRHGNPIQTVSFEPILGNAAEFDANRPTVAIGKNIATLPLTMFSQMVDTVNDATLWGLGPRKIKLSNVYWTRQVYGVCSYFYTVDYEFDIDFNGFDRKIPSYGRKVRAGRWIEPSPGVWEWQPKTLVAAPPEEHSSYIAYKDRHGEPIETYHDENGDPTVVDADVHEIDVEYYPESNFLLLGVPTSF